MFRSEAGAPAVYTAHLYPGLGGHERRMREVPLMLAAMKDDIDSGRSMIFQGDLNHFPDAPEYQRWVDAGLQDSFAAKGTGQPMTIPPTRSAAKGMSSSHCVAVSFVIKQMIGQKSICDMDPYLSSCSWASAVVLGSAAV